MRGKYTMNPYIQYMYSYPHKTAYRPLQGIFLKDYAPLLVGGGHGLYLHIPFCQTKCGYCNLFSVAGQGEKEIDWYLDAVERQSIQYKEVLAPYKPVFSEIVIGGGTPLLLTKKQMERMFLILEEYFPFDIDRELVVETAPNQTTEEKLEVLRWAGVTRVSMGIQSFLDSELSVLGRGHRAQKAREALGLLKSFGFPCINVDFIYGIPGQTADSLLASLEEAVDFAPDEVFLYPLYVRHGVGMEEKGIVPDVEGALEQYRRASRFLAENGYLQESMRRFVKREGEREFSECGLGTSLALGCGGRSYLGKLHFCTPYAVGGKECLEQIKRFEETEDFTRITHGIVLDGEEIKRRYVIRHLLIRPGLDIRRYEQQFKSQVMEDFPMLANWVERGFLHKDKFLGLTEKGMEWSDYLGPRLISPKIRGEMERWEEGNG